MLTEVKSLLWTFIFFCMFLQGSYVRSQVLNATSTLRSGNITTTGILNHLKKHANQVQIINGELEKVLNKAYKDKMQWWYRVRRNK